MSSGPQVTTQIPKEVSVSNTNQHPATGANISYTGERGNWVLEDPAAFLFSARYIEIKGDYLHGSGGCPLADYSLEVSLGSLGSLGPTAHLKGHTISFFHTCVSDTGGPVPG